jgi:hypothetical protein
MRLTLIVTIIYVGAVLGTVLLWLGGWIATRLL